MANKLDNLIPIQQQIAGKTEEQRREECRRAGIASGEARRKKKAMREMLEMCLEMKDKKTGKTYQELATMGLIKGAMRGDSRNYRVMLETLGQLNILEDGNKQNGVLDELLEAINNAKKD